MSTPTIQPTTVAIHAYTFARLVRTTQGASDLPEWEQIPSHKKIHFTNAAKAALRGAAIWDVWAISIGEVPNDAHSTLWRQKAPPYQLIPTALHSFGEVIRALHGNTDVTEEGSPLLSDGEPLGDGPPLIEDDSTEDVTDAEDDSAEEEPDAAYGPVDTVPVEEAIEEHGFGSEEAAEALTEANKKARKR